MNKKNLKTGTAVFEQWMEKELRQDGLFQELRPSMQGILQHRILDRMRYRPNDLTIDLSNPLRKKK